MNVLDENVRDDQRTLLRQWRIPFRQIGKELAASGVQDSDVISLLRTLKRPTLFTQDQDFFRASLCHRDYCLAWLDANDQDAAQFIRRFLRHPVFRTQAQRFGKVVRVHSARLTCFAIGQRAATTLDW